MLCLYGDGMLQGDAGSDLLLRPQVKRENLDSQEESGGTAVCQISGINSASTEGRSDVGAEVKNLD